MNTGFNELSVTTSYTKLALSNIHLTGSGYLIAYVSYESTNADRAYFDDFKVTHKLSPVIQVDDYYPFGMTFNSYSSGTENLYKYTGMEEQKETGWYDYIARQYDPALGRFTSIDPLSEQMRRFSPYNYAFNNPVRFTDPDGMAPSDFIDENGDKTHVEDGSNAVYEIKGEGSSKHYEFKEFDESQGGKNEVNVTTVIQEQQNYNDNNADLEQESGGQTYCNFATQNIMDAVGSAIDADVTVSGRANDMADKLCDDTRYTNVDQAAAEENAANGGLSIMAFKNFSGSGHVASFSVGSNIEKGKVMNVGKKGYQGAIKEAKDVFKTKDFPDIRFYKLNIQSNAACK